MEYFLGLKILGSEYGFTNDFVTNLAESIDESSADTIHSLVDKIATLIAECNEAEEETL